MSITNTQSTPTIILHLQAHILAIFDVFNAFPVNDMQITGIKTRTSLKLFKAQMSDLIYSFTNFNYVHSLSKTAIGTT